MAADSKDDVQYLFDIRVRYYETDKMQVVHNANYQLYFEEARTEMLRDYGLCYAELEKQGYLLPLLEAHVRYISPAFYDDILQVLVRCSVSRGARIRIEYSISRSGEPIAEGYTVHSFVDRDSRRPVRPPRHFWETLSAAAEQRNRSRE